MDQGSAGSGLLVLIAILYFLPALVASVRRHRNSSAIGILNVFLGWTLLGWVVALVWANTDNVRPKRGEERRERIRVSNREERTEPRF